MGTFLGSSGLGGARGRPLSPMACARLTLPWPGPLFGHGYPWPACGRPWLVLAILSSAGFWLVMPIHDQPCLSHCCPWLVVGRPAHRRPWAAHAQCMAGAWLDAARLRPWLASASLWSVMTGHGYPFAGQVLVTSRCFPTARKNLHAKCIPTVPQNLDAR